MFFADFEITQLRSLLRAIIQGETLNKNLKSIQNTFEIQFRVPESNPLAVKKSLIGFTSNDKTVNVSKHRAS